MPLQSAEGARAANRGQAQHRDMAAAFPQNAPAITLVVELVAGEQRVGLDAKRRTFAWLTALHALYAHRVTADPCAGIHRNLAIRQGAHLGMPGSAF